MANPKANWINGISTTFGQQMDNKPIIVSQIKNIISHLTNNAFFAVLQWLNSHL